MISMDGGFDNSNWSFHDKRCRTSWIRLHFRSLTDPMTFTIYRFSETVRFNGIRIVIKFFVHFMFNDTTM